MNENKPKQAKTTKNESQTDPKQSKIRTKINQNYQKWLETTKNKSKQAMV